MKRLSSRFGGFSPARGSLLVRYDADAVDAGGCERPSPDVPFPLDCVARLVAARAGACDRRSRRAAWKRPSRAQVRPPNQSAMYSMVGHKGDLMMIHFRDTVAELNRFELELAQTDLYEYLEPTHSYLSVVELGLYESSAKTLCAVRRARHRAFSPAWNAEVKEVIRRQSEAMASRLFPAIPDKKYLCFYPMDRRRGEQSNWYTVPMSDRQRMMHEHGMIGRRYADQVKQIISGSIGLTIWNGASISSPTIRSSSRSSSTKCASTRSALFMRSLAASISACGSSWRSSTTGWPAT